MTVRELLSWAAAQLPTRGGLPDPRREARWLLARATGVGETWLVGHGEEAVDPRHEALFRDWVARRAAGEPAHYLTGTCPFWGRELLVTPDVLIPRPETELLVAHAVTLPLGTAPHVLDVGTGSGCLAVTLALELPSAAVHATDVQIPALGVARRNARTLGASVCFSLGDLATHLKGPFDLIVANLPYVPEEDTATLPEEVRSWEPRHALFGGPRGTALLERLLEDLPRLLRPGGRALLELGPGQADALAPRLRLLRVRERSRLRDAGGVERVLVLERTSPSGG
jgi:release factor glutamine methyltransferase